MKFTKNTSGMKDSNGNNYITGYKAFIPKKIMIESGMLDEEGNCKEYQIELKDGTIVLFTGSKN